MDKEYKNMSDVELDGVLRQFIKDIEDVEQQIEMVLQAADRMERIDKIPIIQAKYARIKGMLKDASHYTGLSRNANHANFFYTGCFSRVVNKASVDCRAKVNEYRLNVILVSLYAARTDLEHHLLKDYQRKK